MKEELKKILIIDDDVDSLEIACFSLTAIGGYHVDACSSGSEALEKIEKIKPQLILLDVIMPEMDGIETLKKINKIAGYEEVPVIFLTAKVQVDDMELYQTTGVIGVIIKPYDPMELSNTVKNLWKKKT
ncbi:MAG: response regulator [Waddliaceae bacterium]